MPFYSLTFSESFASAFKKLDAGVRERVVKKLRQLGTQDLKRRHLRLGEPFFVEEVGQYRLAYRLDERKKEILAAFIGTHKDYEEFLGIH